MLYNFVLAVDCLGIRERKLIDFHSKRRRITHQVGDLGRATQGLGGYAASIKAGSAKLVTLDYYSRQIMLDGICSKFITTGAAAYYDYVAAVHELMS